jgi:hypothetical protein
MKVRLFICALVLAVIPLSSFAQQPPESLDKTASKTMLPNDYPVYTNGSVTINNPAPGFDQKMLPTNNDYTANPGCYVACYSRTQESSVYAATRDIFVNGQVRVPGTYEGRICKPTGYEAADLSRESHFADVCAKISTCKDKKCWAGGDTGGWFGIQ